ncbi:MAG: PHP domain-containing protein, partial [Acholeplasmataceae bacterium]
MKSSLGFKSSYSFNESMIPLERLLTEVKANGYDFFALADTNLHGMYTFYEQLEQLKLKGS